MDDKSRVSVIIDGQPDICYFLYFLYVFSPSKINKIRQNFILKYCLGCWWHYIYTVSLTLKDVLTCTVASINSALCSGSQKQQIQLLCYQLPGLMPLPFYKPICWQLLLGAEPWGGAHRGHRRARPHCSHWVLAGWHHRALLQPKSKAQSSQHLCKALGGHTQGVPTAPHMQIWTSLTSFFCSLDLWEKTNLSQFGCSHKTLPGFFQWFWVLSVLYTTYAHTAIIRTTSGSCWKPPGKWGFIQKQVLGLLQDKADVAPK